MQRVFTEDIIVNGKPKFHAGMMKDYPRNTWSGLEASMGRPLNDFTITAEEAARRGVQKDPASPKGNGRRLVSPGKGRTQLKE